METNLNLVVGQNIRKYRKLSGLSQEKLAEKCGLHRTYIGGIERGERNITLASLQVIATALDRTPIELLLEEQDV